MLARLLYWYSGRLPCRVICTPAGPYLERYFLFQAWGRTFYLHRFVASDPEAEGVHNHPWQRAWSFLLVGGYWEVRESVDGFRWLRWVRWFNSLDAGTLHRVVVPWGRQVWGIFVHTEVIKPWGFYKRGRFKEFQYTTDRDDSLKVGTSSERWWTYLPNGNARRAARESWASHKPIPESMRRRAHG